MTHRYVVETNELSKKFGDYVAVKNLNLKIETGERYGLLGPNGSGKTTLIKMLCGLLKPTKGKAWVLGETVPSRNILKRIGYMPQDVALYLDLTVHENLILFGEIYNLKKNEILKRERELLEFIGLEKWRDAPVYTLSGGMKHRLSLVCSLIHEPELLFLDEPTVGVDPELRVAFWQYFDKLSEKGVTIVLTTHYMDEVLHCTKVGLMRTGILIAEGTPEKLMKDTKTASLESAFIALSKGVSV